MGFIRRLGWYLVGLSIGLVFLFFFLNKKSKETDTEFCYFPNCRVLKELRSKPLAYGSESMVPLDSLSLLDVFKNGKVDFGRSDTQREPCKEYVIVNGEKTMELVVDNCSDEVIVKEVPQLGD